VSQAERAGVRRICYLSGTRADFGLMTATLRAIAADPRLSLQLIVTGMHLSAQYGLTVTEIEQQGFDIAARVPVDQTDASQATMARNVGSMLIGIVNALEALRPDALLLLGDRGEMLAGALAAIHLGIPVVHLHGGERSGTVDEPVRHAISKLAHLHLVATSDARDRLVRMGERGYAVHITGAPGVDGIVALATASRDTLCSEAGFDARQPVALFVYHPVLHEVQTAARDTRAAAQAALDAGCQVMALMPNSDAGNEGVRQVLQDMQTAGRFVVKTHLPRPQFISWMAEADVLLGNSSSGIIEAASFGTPVVNIGSRQHMRERNRNVIDTEAEPAALQHAIAQALAWGRLPSVNVYGDGQAAARIAGHLASFDLSPSLLAKCNAY
jgi:GDP/UDP-N,N'-diacetylbacillosamine 2-epimerase (hydrolysing)